MILSKLIAGMEILKKYYDKDWYCVGTDSDIVRLFATDKPVSEEDRVKLIDLGWSQNTEEYTLMESWNAYL